MHFVLEELEHGKDELSGSGNILAKMGIAISATSLASALLVFFRLFEEPLD